MALGVHVVELQTQDLKPKRLKIAFLYAFLLEAVYEKHTFHFNRLMKFSS